MVHGDSHAHTHKQSRQIFSLQCLCIIVFSSIFYCFLRYIHLIFESMFHQFKVVRAGLNVDIAPDLTANQLNVRNGALILQVYESMRFFFLVPQLSFVFIAASKSFFFNSLQLLFLRFLQIVLLPKLG